MIFTHALYTWKREVEPWNLRAQNVPGLLPQSCDTDSTTSFNSYDSLGRPTQSTQDGYGFNSYQYFRDGRVKQMSYPSGRVVTYTVDGAGRINQVSGNLNGAGVTYASIPNNANTPVYGYAAHGALKQMSLGNGTLEQTCYNNRMQPVGIRLGSAATTACTSSSDLLNLTFNYGTTNNSGNLQSQLIGTISATQNYAYSDNLYITENSGGRYTTYRITADGKLSMGPSSVLLFPNSLIVDPSGNVWETGPTGIAAAGPNLTYRQVLPFGYRGDGGPLIAAEFYSPNGLALGPDGAIYLNDSNNGRVRKITLPKPSPAPSISASGIVNAASFTGGAVAPGELVSIFGSNLGPASLLTFSLDNNSVPPVLGNVTVSFAGQNAALTAVSANQINAFVPYSVAGQTSVSVVVTVDGVPSAPVAVPVAPSAFAIFAADASGSGQGAILNQDGSYNSPAAPVAAGSIISLYGTGEGTTSPQLPDGAVVISTPFPMANLPVSVTIGGQPAEVTYAGAAPLLPTGVFQINARIPLGTPAGDAPVTAKVGLGATVNRVTVAVR